jgi:hypothetical protein
MQQVANVVQQGSRDQCRVGAITLGKRGALQGMVELADAFTIGFMAASIECGANLVHHGHGLSLSIDVMGGFKPD